MTAVQEPQHRINIPHSLWCTLQVIAKHNDKSCSEYASEALNSVVEQALTGKDVVNLDAPRIPGDQRDPLLARKTNLGCAINEFDGAFNRAWAWAVRKFGSELALVEHLEEQVSLPPPATMHHPRAVVFSRWKRAGSPR